MDTKCEIKTLLGREPETIPVVFKGKKGFIPVYFNYTDRNCASKLFSETEEGALVNFLTHLKTKQGDNNGIDPTSIGSGSAENQSTGNTELPVSGTDNQAV